MAAGAIVIVSGPPGAGKTTVATELVAEHDLALRLVGDTFWSAIERGAVLPYLPESQHQNEVVVRALGAAAAEFAAGGYLVVLETVIAPWLLDEATVAARRRGVEVHYVVLRPDADTVLRRAVARPGDALRERAAIMQLHGEFGDLGPYERHVVDSSHLDVEGTAAEVLRGIADGRFRVDATPSPSPPR